jgi:hypothetical protein
MWSRIFRTLSAEHGLSVADDARFYAMLYLTEADAAIACWTDKAHWMFWRPITAIRQADTDGNPATTADPAWLPLIDTPPYPDHPSGHNCVSGSTVRTLRDFFGTNRVPITATSNAPGHTDLTRSYARLPDVIHEIIEARIYGGLHFRAADEQGARIGFEVAAYRQAHFFHPRPWRWHSR